MRVSEIRVKRIRVNQGLGVLLLKYFVWLFLKYHLTMYSSFSFYRYHCSHNHSWICQKSVPTIQRIFTIYQCELNGQAWTQDQTNNKHKQENIILIVPPNSLSQTIISLFSLVWWEKEKKISTKAAYVETQQKILLQCNNIYYSF